MYGERLSGHCRLVYIGLALGDFTVKRNHISGADDYKVAFFYLISTNKHLAVSGLFPNLIDVQRHRSGKVTHGLFVSPLLKHFSYAEHKHYRACGIEVASCKGHADSRRIEHRNRELAVKQ